MPYASSGQRDKYVQIQKGVAGKGASGQPIVTWTDLIAVWMRKADVSGQERLAAAQLQASVDSEWEMPYVSTMDPELVDVPKARRLSYQGRVYNITRAVLGDRPEGRSIRLWTLATSGL